MNMVRLIYVSRFAPGIGTPDINDILQASRENNKEKDVTGILCYAPGVFLQCLEGPRPAVNQLYRRIAADDRHKDVTMLEYADTDERAFGKWSMAYVRVQDLGELTEPLSGQGSTFNPFEMTAGEAYEFVTSIAEKRQDLMKKTIRDMES
jgi:hypothetical protein